MGVPILRRGLVAACALALLAGVTATAAEVHADTKPLESGGFEVAHELVLPGSPERVYDAMTGDISGWWDHSFSEKPYKLYIEPWPGGGFCEVFDRSGDGVRHATVTWAQRGKRLRMEGPLGLAGRGIVCVTTVDLAARGDSTDLKLGVRCAGESLGPEIALAVDRAWKHFLLERLLPYLVSGSDRHKKPWPRPKS